MVQVIRKQFRFKRSYSVIILLCFFALGLVLVGHGQEGAEVDRVGQLIAALKDGDASAENALRMKLRCLTSAQMGHFEAKS